MESGADDKKSGAGNADAAEEGRALLGFDHVEQAGLADWRLLLSKLHARFVTADFATAFQLVERVTAVAEAANHHPDIDLRWGAVGITLTSHDVGGVTTRDLRLAEQISEIAADLEAEPRPREVAAIEVALDTSDHERIRAFWCALLGSGDDQAADDELVDPRGYVPTLWFQPTEHHDPPRQRFHLDVWVPADVAQQRVAQAVAAGGHLVTDEFAPSFWVLADADGNRACVCTSQRAAAAV